MFRITIGGIKRNTYDSKSAFDKWWARHVRNYGNFYPITGFEYRDNKWVEIRKHVGETSK